MANFNFNNVMLGGRLTADPEIKKTQSGKAVVSFTIAVSRRTAKDAEPMADFINCVAWEKTAETIAHFFKRGSSIFVVGELQVRSYTANDGGKRYVTEVIVRDIRFVDTKAESAATNKQMNTAPAYPQSATPQQQADAPQFEVLSEDDELPF